MTIHFEEIMLHPAGDVIPGKLIYEPLGNYQYLWRTQNRKDVSQVLPFKENKKMLFYYINIGDKFYRFDGKPLKKLVFKVPTIASIEKYINNSYNIKTSADIYKEVKTYIKTFYDYPLEYYYDVASLIVLTTWISQILRVAIYCFITARFGGGKTVNLEILENLLKHGFMAGNTSPAVLARLVSSQKLNTLHDEIDVKSKDKDSEEYLIIRQGYRRGNKYVRCKANTFEPDISDPFGIKIFSLHGGIERALSQRGLHIYCSKTKDKRLPVINIYKENYSLNIFEDLFFWSFDNLLKPEVSKVSQVAGVSKVLEVSDTKTIDQLRNEIFIDVTSNFTKEDIEFIRSFDGRDLELSYLALYVCKIYEIDIKEELKQAFEYKQELEEEHGETFLLNKLKEDLIYFYNQKKPDAYREGQVTEDGLVYITNKEIYSQFSNEVKEMGLIGISTQKFKEYMMELGFIDKINRKKKKIAGESILCLFYDSDIKKSLGLLETKETPATQGTQATEELVVSEEKVQDDL